MGTPRALPVFARGGWRGLSSKPDGPPAPEATGGFRRGQGDVIPLVSETPMCLNARRYLAG